jgi:predicted TIM-barrel fold metal-dependent hydrolase
MKIIDCHCHIYPEKIAVKATESIGNFYELPMSANLGTSAQLIENGKKIGVTKYLVCSVATIPEQTHSINNFIKSEVDAHPEFFGFGAYHQDNDPVETVAAIKNHNFKGIKIHPDFQKCDIDDPKLYKLYEELADCGLPVLFHMGDNRYDYSHPKRLARVLEDFPYLKAIAAHLGGYQTWKEALTLLSVFVKKGNIRFDECSSLAFLDTLTAKNIVRQYGSENIFFGSDFPMWAHTSELELLQKLELSDSEYEYIFHKSAEEFFNL